MRGTLKFHHMLGNSACQSSYFRFTKLQQRLLLMLFKQMSEVASSTHSESCLEKFDSVFPELQPEDSNQKGNHSLVSHVTGRLTQLDIPRQ